LLPSDPEEIVLLEATVTLPAGRAAVVHATTIGSGGPVVGDQEPAELTAVVLESFAAAADPDEHCPAIRNDSPPVATAPEGDQLVWFSASVLCTEERCSVEAEAYGPELDEEHPAADRLRAWAPQLEGAQP
jgi:hypothetical protein